MLAAEDRGAGRNRGPIRAGQHPRRFPSEAIGQAHRRLKTLHYRFTALEEAHGEHTLRPLSRDYVEFAYEWSEGTGLADIPLPQGVDFGDAIKSVKSLYSTLRQLEWAIPAETHLRGTVHAALRSMERDLIRRV
jgi:hypothetical protein